MRNTRLRYVPHILNQVMSITNLSPISEIKSTHHKLATALSLICSISIDQLVVVVVAALVADSFEVGVQLLGCCDAPHELVKLKPGNPY